MHLLKSVLPKSLNPAQRPRIDIYIVLMFFKLEFVAIDEISKTSSSFMNYNKINTQF